MEQIMIVEQAKTDLLSILEQVKTNKTSAIITDEQGVSVKISFVENAPKIQGKRLGGFLKNTNNTTAPDDFDRMNEDEIYALFSGEYDESAH